MFTLNVITSQIDVTRFGTIRQNIEVGSQDPTRMNQWINPAYSRTLDANEQLRCLGLLPGDEITMDNNGRIISFAPSIAAPNLNCPYCTTPITAIGSLLTCTNVTCRGRQAARLAHFCSAEAFNIPGARDLSYTTWSDIICRQPRLKSIASMFSPYVSQDMAGTVGDPIAQSVAQSMNFLKANLSYGRNTQISQATLMTLLEAMSIPGMTMRTFQILTRPISDMIEDVPPLTMVAACMMQPQILMRFTDCTDEIIFLTRQLDQFYVNEFMEISNYVVGQT